MLVLVTALLPDFFLKISETSREKLDGFLGLEQIFPNLKSQTNKIGQIREEHKWNTSIKHEVNI